VAANPVIGGGQFDFSATGMFVYVPGKSSAQAWQVAWMDSSGRMQPLLATPGTYAGPRLSPDGTKMASNNGQGVYIYDLERETTSRLTFAGRSANAIWAPDSKHMVFRTIGNANTLFWVRSDGSGVPQKILQSPNNIVPYSFSPGGRRLAYYETSPNAGFDIWTLPLDLTDPNHPKPGKPEPFLHPAADEYLSRFSPDGRWIAYKSTASGDILPRFSPDGHWIAYRSNESGNNEVYVRPFPNGSEGKWQISAGGGLYPLWANNGRQLFYETTDNRIMVVDYTVNGASFAHGKPRLWSDRQLFYTGTTNLDLAPDGKRFAVLAQPETTPGEKGSVHVTMLLNFFDELKRRIP
jgi:Tol biopolymer transport system component